MGGDRPRATIVPFPAGPRSAGAVPALGGRQATVVRPWGDHDADAPHNQSWEELLRLVDQAWTWRDPETLSEIEACVLRLAIVVEADWS